MSATIESRQHYQTSGLFLALLCEAIEARGNRQPPIRVHVISLEISCKTGMWTHIETSHISAADDTFVDNRCPTFVFSHNANF